LRALKFEGMNSRHENIEEAHKKTFDWVLHGPEDAVDSRVPKHNFVSWLRDGKGIYWISGKAGSGKSTIMKYLSNDERVQIHLSYWSGREYAFAHHYFWALGKQQTLVGVLRSLLYHVLKKFPALIPVVFENYFNDLVVQAKYSHRQQSEVLSLSDHSIKDAFNRLARQNLLSIDLCFFIDGLDEYDGSDDDKRRLVNLLKDAVVSGNTNHQRIKICVSSRREIVFEDAFKECPGFRMQDLTGKDILQYVEDRLMRQDVLDMLTDNERPKIHQLIEAIVQKASGVFLWVTIVVKDLIEGISDGDKIPELRAKLDELPDTLEGLYERMLEKIKPPKQKQSYFDQARHYFNVVEAARSPPSILTVALTDMDPRPFLDMCSKLMTPIELEDQCLKTERRLKSRCAGILELYTGENEAETDDDHEGCPVNESILKYKVEFLHRTARDYIESLGTFESNEACSALEALMTSAMLQLKHYKLLAKPDPDAIIERWCDTLFSFYYAAYRLEKLRDTASVDKVDLLSQIMLVTWHEMKDEGLKPAYLAKNNSYHVGNPMAMATWLGLSHFVRAKVTATTYEEYNSGEWSLLMSAVCGPYTAIAPWAPINPTTIKHLLGVGADPNEPWPRPALPTELWTEMFLQGGSTSPWHELLTTMKFDKEGYEHAVDFLDAYELFVRNGADLTKPFKSTAWDEPYYARDVLNDFESKFPEQTKMLRDLLLEKDYQRSSCQEEVTSGEEWVSPHKEEMVDDDL
jgi:hypothetical protein